MYLEKLDDIAKELLDATFPEYKGRNFKVEYADTVNFPNTQWSGGFKCDYKIVRLEDMKALPIPEAPFLERSKAYEEEQPLPEGYVVVEHCTMSGRDLGITFTANPKGIHLLPETKIDLSNDEKIVLVVTRSLKPSYAGVSDYRFREAAAVTNISKQEYEKAKNDLMANKLLNNAGAITAKGRNAIGYIDLHDLRKKVNGP